MGGGGGGLAGQSSWGWLGMKDSTQMQTATHITDLGLGGAGERGGGCQQGSGTPGGIYIREYR